MVANGGEIADFGAKLLKFEFNDGDSLNMRFRLANVTNPFGSVGNVCDKGTREIFASEGSYVELGSSGKRIPLRRQQGVRRRRVGRRWPGEAGEGLSGAGVEAARPEVREARVASGPTDPSASGRKQHEVTLPTQVRVDGPKCGGPRTQPVVTTVCVASPG